MLARDDNDLEETVHTIFVPCFSQNFNNNFVSRMTHCYQFNVLSILIYLVSRGV
jgi:hypothetical protein